ncbi:MAG TPA: fibronectin type III domain-containing protein [Candidatus Thermoplasmatota archaeon]|nr:fibronectin type III domain-containing protein [Candidatus Thermoplasmatota archaeon]
MPKPILIALILLASLTLPLVAHGQSETPQECRGDERPGEWSGKYAAARPGPEAGEATLRGPAYSEWSYAAIYIERDAYNAWHNSYVSDWYRCDLPPHTPAGSLTIRASGTEGITIWEFIAKGLPNYDEFGYYPFSAPLVGIVAYNAHGTSLQFVMDARPPPPPTAPQNLRVEPGEKDGTFNLSWDPAPVSNLSWGNCWDYRAQWVIGSEPCEIPGPAVREYLVYRRGPGDLAGGAELVARLPGDTLRLEDRDLRPGFRYGYFVASLSAAGRSLYPPSAIVTAPGPLPCSIKSFEELAADFSQYKHELEDAKRFEEKNGKGVVIWHPSQQGPGKFEARAKDFIAKMEEKGFKGNITSAYRPALYQAHFGNLRTCGEAIYELGQEFGPDSESLARNLSYEQLSDIQTLINRIDEEMRTHALREDYGADGKNLTERMIRAGMKPAVGVKTPHLIIGKKLVEYPLKFGYTGLRVPYVCYRNLESCEHVNGRAIDVAWKGGVTSDLVKAADDLGWCRPYGKEDPVHWEEKKHDKNKTCSGAAKVVGTINSPVAVLLVAPDGRRVGFDPETGAQVNDFGEDASISDTHPIIITLDTDMRTATEMVMTGVGTGEGPYKIALTIYDLDAPDPVEIASSVTSGNASTGITLEPIPLPPIPAIYLGTNRDEIPLVADPDLGSGMGGGSVGVPQSEARPTPSGSTGEDGGSPDHSGLGPSPGETGKLTDNASSGNADEVAAKAKAEPARPTPVPFLLSLLGIGGGAILLVRRRQ